MSLWKKIEVFEEFPPLSLEPDDICLYAREYVSGGGYEAGEANQLIVNFKKPQEREQNQGEWYFKQQAVSKFARELSSLLPEGIHFAFIPCSKTKDDPEYDRRFEMLWTMLHHIRRDLILCNPFSFKTSHKSAHLGGTRDIDEIYNSLNWHGLEENEGLEKIVLIDDMITSGSHFKACQKLILEHHPDIRVIGVFWTRAKKIFPTDP